MSRVHFDLNKGSSGASDWSPVRFFAWTTLMAAMVFWGVLIALV